MDSRLKQCTPATDHTDRNDLVMCGQWKQIALVLLLCSLSATVVHAQDKTPAQGPKVTGNVITLIDGYTFEADEVWKQGDEIWYRKGNITQRVPQAVTSVKPIYEQPKPNPAEVAKTTKTETPQSTKVWIHLVDG